MANPTATSAAAKAIIKNTKTCPEALLWYTEKVANSKFTAFSINSTDMKIMIAFLRISTPITPIQKMSRLNRM